MTDTLFVRKCIWSSVSCDRFNNR